ncbi:MAG: hypothetical protein MUF40_01875, partial [Gemmatimonadaceae bacterium]|nr:hypothetical protein [Gemmatimonadaceae bacterium]
MSAAEDVVLTPGAGDPLCWSVIVVVEEGARRDYLARSALVRPAPTLRDAATCRVRRPADLVALDTAPAPDTVAVHWTGEWRAPLAELRTLAATDCRLAAALRFMRVPAWEREGATTTLWDLRYGR